MVNAKKLANVWAPNFVEYSWHISCHLNSVMTKFMTKTAEDGVRRI